MNRQTSILSGSVNNYILTDDPPKKKKFTPQQEIEFDPLNTEL